MRSSHRFAALVAALLATVSSQALCGAARAQATAPTKNIYAFPVGFEVGFQTDVSSDLTADAAGDLYGVTPSGGPTSGCQGAGCGTIYRLVPPTAKGQPWTQQTLYQFGDGGSGAVPQGKPVLDAAGSVYGTTLIGPLGTASGGTVWKLSPPAVAGEAWKLTVLAALPAASPTPRPVGGVVMDRAGVLYGVVAGGGAYNQGYAYSLAPPVPGATAWTEAVLHDFHNRFRNEYPTAPLALSPDQETLSGVVNYGQTIFRLRRSGDAWAYKLIYHGLTLGEVYGGLLVDRNNNLFGTTRNSLNSAGPYGSVFELSPPLPGQTSWSVHVLHYFVGTDGEAPVAALVAGGLPSALYGTTTAGGQGGAVDGSKGKYGVVFRLDPPVSGAGPWTCTVLHAFAAGPGAVGGAGDIQTGLTFGPNRFLFGVGTYGGLHGDGAVFAQTPH